MSDGGEGGGGGGDMVPRARLAEETAKLRAAQARVGELETEVRTLTTKTTGLERKAGSHDALVSQLTELKAKLEASEKGREQDATLIGLGFNDLELLRLEHRRAGKDAGALEDWARKLKEGKAEDAPATLRSMLEAAGGGKGDGGEDGKGDGGEGGGGTTRNANAGSPGGNPPVGSGTADEARLKALQEEALKTGDWSQYQEARGIKTGAA